ncbi:MAG: peptidoglycan-binding domain-containing protein [Trueperaceae bacterium]
MKYKVHNYFVLLFFLGCLLLACSNPSPNQSELSDAASELLWPTLRSGSSGRDVVTAQYLLRAEGYTLSVDGSFGSGTDSVVKQFQSANGLSSDGVVGPNTWEKLIVTVQKNSSGNAVRALQDQLKNRYAYSLDITGQFRTTTETHVKDFQSSRGLTANGIVTINTWSALVSQQSGGSRVDIAKRIQNNSRVTLWNYSPVSSSSTDGADAHSNIRDTADGKAAEHSCYDNAPCGTVLLSSTMLSAMESMAGSYTIRVTSIAGGSHSVNSSHYSGTAFDTDTINGVAVSSSNSYYRAFMQRCRDLGAKQVYGPGDSGHSAHVHCSW